jgi:putative hydrolase of the HAD superfamily
VSGWRAIVFDLDDTLYPERDYVLSGFRAVAAWSDPNLGIPAEQGFAEMQALLDQGVRSEVFNRWLEGHGLLDNGRVARLVALYRQHEPKISLFPEVTSLLSSLQNQYYLGLVTDGYWEVQQRKLAALNLAGYFDAIVFADEWGRGAWKPSPVPFYAVLERLGHLSPTQSVYVADNPAKDFLGARRVGMATVWVRRPTGFYANQEPADLEHHPDICVTSLDELSLALGRLTDRFLINVAG